MDQPQKYLPQQVNTGPFIPAYSLPELEKRLAGEEIVLPVCSLGEPVDNLALLGDWVLPPLYHEALDIDLKISLIDRVLQCFPFHRQTNRRAGFGGSVKVVEVHRSNYEGPTEPRVAAFSVDTAVEEHGPHLPLGTDTLQSYAVLQKLEEEIPGWMTAPPVEYGHLTWGLPFGMSVDITPELLTRYVTGYANALLDWVSPQAIYVVDVHGSPVHRAAIEEGLQNSRVSRWSFRWLHEPLVEFAGERGDQHAGGVETALIEHINPTLLTADWNPQQLDQLADGQMSLREASELTGEPNSELSHFIEYVERRADMDDRLNGIVGDIRNYHRVNAAEMFDRMLDVARQDIQRLV